MFYRAEKKKNFTIIPNSYLNDDRLSWPTKGIFTKILSLPNDWNFSVRGLAKACKSGIDAIRTVLNQLITFSKFYIHSPLHSDKYHPAIDVRYFVIKKLDKFAFLVYYNNQLENKRPLGVQPPHGLNGNVNTTMPFAALSITLMPEFCKR